MYENDFEMHDATLPTTSKAAAALSIANSTAEEVSEDEDHEDSPDSLWAIEDDTMFSPLGLMNHSAGKGKSVFVAWTEKYLLNFVFKTSNKTKRTTLTKVRLKMPDEVVNILILDMNTLLLTSDGCVYYFSSVKSIHNVCWLTNIRCMASCPQTHFSIIRFVNSREEPSEKQLLLEVYQDIPQVGKYSNGMDVIRHSYDISFDTLNVFNCDWSGERYTLMSVISNEENIEFLRQLVAMGNFIRTEEEKTVLELNHEVHVFTISGNMFILVGAKASESDVTSSPHPTVENFSIQLLNTYASNIECIRMDAKNNLLIVLLQCGQMDVWYKSPQRFGSIFHLNHQLSYFTHYDFNTSDNTFYFTKPEEVTQLRIIYNIENAGNECMISESHKAICGMMACTWVESLQQLITLSSNNIFYRLCFEAMDEKLQDSFKAVDTQYENLGTLYVLTSKKIKELLSKAQVIDDLMEQPARLHEAVEKEWQKQQLLSLGYKQKLWKKILKSHIEYHIDFPTLPNFTEDVCLIQTTFDQDGSDEQSFVHALIYIKLTKTDGIFIPILQTASWQLQIAIDDRSLLLHVPAAIIDRQLCFIVKYSMKNKHLLPEFSVSFQTFVKHCSFYICISFEVDVTKNEHTFKQLFSYRVQQLPLYRSCAAYKLDDLINEFNNMKSAKNSSDKTMSELKQIFKIPQQMLLKILSILVVKFENVLNTDLKIYFLRQYELNLNYDEKNQVLTIRSLYPKALFYIKMFLMYELKSFSQNDVDVKDLASFQHKIMQYQCDIERLYGSLTSSEYMDDGSSSSSLHLENLLKIYSKLRCEFNDIYR